MGRETEGRWGGWGRERGRPSPRRPASSAAASPPRPPSPARASVHGMPLRRSWSIVLVGADLLLPWRRSGGCCRGAAGRQPARSEGRPAAAAVRANLRPVAVAASGAVVGHGHPAALDVAHVVLGPRVRASERPGRVRRHPAGGHRPPSAPPRLQQVPPPPHGVLRLGGQERSDGGEPGIAQRVVRGQSLLEDAVLLRAGRTHTGGRAGVSAQGAFARATRSWRATPPDWPRVPPDVNLRPRHVVVVEQGAAERGTAARHSRGGGRRLNTATNRDAGAPFRRESQTRATASAGEMR